jgi:DNA-binding HxlR family transcriptional regulator
VPHPAMNNGSPLCPRFHRAIELIGRRWTGAIIFVLFREPARFGELRDAIPEITDRMLAERLRELEGEGIVERVAVPGAPARAAYSLTGRGRALGDAVAAIASWSHEWLADSRECPPHCSPEVVRSTHPDRAARGHSNASTP